MQNETFLLLSYQYILNKCQLNAFVYEMHFY